jgi:hypothetical protein
VCSEFLRRFVRCRPRILPWPIRRRTDAPVKKPDLAPWPALGAAPWPAPGAGRGPVAWSDDELSAVIRECKIEFPGPTPEAEAEAQWEAKLHKAITSGAIERGDPGRKPVRPSYLALAQKCLDEANGNSAQARETFIDQAMKTRGIQRNTAETRWAEAMKTLSTER